MITWKLSLPGDTGYYATISLNVRSAEEPGKPTVESSRTALRLALKSALEVNPIGWQGHACDAERMLPFQVHHCLQAFNTPTIYELTLSEGAKLVVYPDDKIPLGAFS